MDSAAIQKRLDLLEKSEAEFKTKKDMLNDSLKSDEELITLEDKMKDARQRYTAQKQALLNEPENRKLMDDLKDLTQEIKDTKKLLGDELIAYFMKNQTLEYVTPSGEKKRFSVSAKFVRGKEDGE
ncbi:MAG: hypothetical protein WCO52_01730 [bacterium]